MMKMIPPSEFGEEVAQYDPVNVIQMCGQASRVLDQSRQNMWQGNLGGQNAIVTQHALAELVMWAIRSYPEALNKRPLDVDVVRLANNIYSIQDPFLGTKAGGLMTLIRTAYEQFPYQEKLQHLIPRHLMLYLESNPPQVKFDIDVKFKTRTGLTVKEFMMIGLIFYSATLANHSFTQDFIERSHVKSIQQYINGDKLDAFLAIAGGDFATFRSLRLKEERETPDLERFTFNPLISHPIVKLPNNILCVPVPRLLIHRITRGLYFDLMDIYYQPGRNPFLEWFGYAFEQYIGTLLKDTFGKDNVYPEPRYGKPEVSGPDWIVIVGDTALVFECRSGRLPKKLKGHTDKDEIIGMIKRNIIDTASKIPKKIDDLQKGLTDIHTENVKSYVSIIVTYEEWYPTQLTLDLAKKELKGTDADNFCFELMSADDIEWLLAWAKHEDPVRVLLERHNDAEGSDLSIGQYVGVRAKRKNITKLEKRLLAAKQAEFLGEILPKD